MNVSAMYDNDAIRFLIDSQLPATLWCEGGDL